MSAALSPAFSGLSIQDPSRLASGASAGKRSSRPASAGTSSTPPPFSGSHHRSGSCSDVATPNWMKLSGFSKREYFEAARGDSLISPVSDSASIASSSSGASVIEPQTPPSRLLPFLPLQSPESPSRPVHVDEIAPGRFEVSVDLPGFDMLLVTWRKDHRMTITADRWDKPSRDSDGTSDAPKGEHFERILDFGIVSAKQQKTANSVLDDNGTLRISVTISQERDRQHFERF